MVMKAEMKLLIEDCTNLAPKKGRVNEYLQDPEQKYLPTDLFLLKSPLLLWATLSALGSCVVSVKCVKASCSQG